MMGELWIIHWQFMICLQDSKSGWSFRQICYRSLPNPWHTQRFVSSHLWLLASMGKWGCGRWWCGSKLFQEWSGHAVVAAALFILCKIFCRRLFRLCVISSLWHSRCDLALFVDLVAAVQAAIHPFRMEVAMIHPLIMQFYQCPLA